MRDVRVVAPQLDDRWQAGAGQSARLNGGSAITRHSTHSCSVSGGAPQEISTAIADCTTMLPMSGEQPAAAPAWRAEPGCAACALHRLRCLAITVPTVGCLLGGSPEPSCGCRMLQRKPTRIELKAEDKEEV